MKINFDDNSVGCSATGCSVIIVVIIILVVLFAGEPDLLDALIHRLMSE